VSGGFCLGRVPSEDLIEWVAGASSSDYGGDSERFRVAMLQHMRGT
jgi:hypothetical protein